MWRFFDKYGQERSSAVAGAGTVVGQVPTWDGDSYEPVLPVVPTPTMAHIATQTVASNGGLLTFDNLPQTYNHLLILGRGTQVVYGPQWILYRVNNIATGVYDLNYGFNTAATRNDGESGSAGYAYMSYGFGDALTRVQQWEAWIHNYTSSTNKFSTSVFGSDWGGGSNGVGGRMGGTITNLIRVTSVITRLDFATTSWTDGFIAGTTISIFGVKNG